MQGISKELSILYFDWKEFTFCFMCGFDFTSDAIVFVSFHEAHIYCSCFYMDLYFHAGLLWVIWKYLICFDCDFFSHRQCFDVYVGRLDFWLLLLLMLTSTKFSGFMFLYYYKLSSIWYISHPFISMHFTVFFAMRSRTRCA